MRPILALLAILAAAAALADSPPLEPFFGTWKVDYQRSFDKARANPEIKEDSLTVAQYMTGMSKVMEMSVGEDFLTYTRGNHTRQVPYALVSIDADTVTVSIDVEGKVDQLSFSWAEKGYMFIESTTTKREDFFVYKKVSDETAAPIPAEPEKETDSP